MALVPIRIDRTSKPPLGTPLRSDGHWSVQGLVGAWAFNEGGGTKYANGCTNVISSSTNITNNPSGITDNGTGYVDCGVMLSGMSKFTVIAQIKCTNVSAQRQIVSSGYNGTYTEWQMYIEQSTGKLCFGTYNGSEVCAKSAGYVAGRVITAAGSYAGGVWSAFVDGALSGQTSGIGPVTTNRKLMLGAIDIDNTPGQFFYGDIGYVLVFNRALSPQEIASLPKNPWQIYEPEIVWIEVPDEAGGTAYTDTLTALAESYASVTDVATYVDAATALIAAGVDASSAVVMTEAVLSTAQAADTMSDMVQRVESLLSVVQAADTVADAQAMAESLVSEITASVSVADGLNNSSTESLATEIAAASTVQDVVTMLEQVYTTLEAVASATDEVVHGVAENLLASVEAITSVTDLQLMTDSVTTLAIGGATIAEIGIYLESVVSAAVGGASVTDIVAGPLRRIYALSVSVRDPLALSVSVRDPLALSVSVRDPLSLNIAVSPW